MTPHWKNFKFPAAVEAFSAGILIALALTRILRASGALSGSAALALMISGIAAGVIVALCRTIGDKLDTGLLEVGALMLFAVSPLAAAGGVFRPVPGIAAGMVWAALRSKRGSRFGFGAGVLAGGLYGSFFPYDPAVWQAALALFGAVTALHLIKRPAALAAALFFAAAGSLFLIPMAGVYRPPESWCRSSAAYPAALLPDNPDGVTILWVAPRNSALAEIWGNLFFVRAVNAAAMIGYPESALDHVPDASSDLVLVEDPCGRSVPARRRLFADAWRKRRGPGSVLVIPAKFERDLPPGKYFAARVPGDRAYLAVASKEFTADTEKLETRLDGLAQKFEQTDFRYGLFGAFYTCAGGAVRTIEIAAPAPVSPLPAVLGAILYWLVRFRACRRGAPAIDFAAAENGACAALLWLAAFAGTAAMEEVWRIPAAAWLALWALWFLAPPLRKRVGRVAGAVSAAAALTPLAISGAGYPAAAAALGILVAGGLFFSFPGAEDRRDAAAWCGVAAGAALWLAAGGSLSFALVSAAALRLISLSDLIRRGSGDRPR